MRQHIPYPPIRELREEKHWSQSAIAQMLHISQTCYSKYEIGTSDIPVLILIDLARLHQVSIDYLLGETDIPKRYE